MVLQEEGANFVNKFKCFVGMRTAVNDLDCTRVGT